jgi:hypothetical protein
MDEAYLAAARASILCCPSNERWIGQTVLKADDVVGSDRLVDGHRRVDEALRDQGCKVGSVGTRRQSAPPPCRQLRSAGTPLHRLQVESAVYPPAWLSFQQVVLT